MFAARLAIASLLAVGMASCQSSKSTDCCPQKTPRAQVKQDPGRPRGDPMFTQVSYQAVVATVPKIPDAEFVKDDEICMQCHEDYAKTFANNVHRGDGCESCHGPASKHVETRGKEPGLIFSFKHGDPVIRAEACLRCHEQNQCTEGSRWRTSKHANCGVTCVDCHRGHYNVPPGTPATKVTQIETWPDGRLVSFNRLSAHAEEKPKQPSLRGTSHHLGAMAPQTCYRCHGDMQVFQQIAGPHQICGPNGFNCTTCHDPHGQVLEYTRKDLCLQCHSQHAPTMAWHSSTHNLNGVCCTDCHNPHPRACVPQVVDIYHGNGPSAVRPKRLAMAVDEPYTCYKCHPKIYGLNALPSHHPIKEGKMVCSDCHDPHGQTTDNLKEATVNLVCYKCHADKQGPFAFEHPPVRENCGICHNPHGAVANNLLKQPATFLCLRCHAGHNGGPEHPGTAGGTNINMASNPNPTLLHAGFYSDCTQCHQQIHGTNMVSQRGAVFYTR
jgi:DmsE family decaheme c-type cytochrome